MNKEKTIEELENLKNDLLNKINNLDETIALLKSLSKNGTNTVMTKEKRDSDTDISEEQKQILSKYDNYDKNATMVSKVAFVLKTENRFLHLRQIAKILHLNEPNISEKDFTTKLYPAISKLKSSGAIVKYNVGTSNINSFWGSKNWLNMNNGTPKEEHKYDEDAVTTFGSEVIEI